MGDRMDATARVLQRPHPLSRHKTEETTSILPASSGAWAGMEARQQPYRRGGRRQRGGRVAGLRCARAPGVTERS